MHFYNSVAHLLFIKNRVINSPIVTIKEKVDTTKEILWLERKQLNLNFTSVKTNCKFNFQKYQHYLDCIPWTKFYHRVFLNRRVILTIQGESSYRKKSIKTDLILFLILAIIGFIK